MKTNAVQQNIPSGWQENKILDCLRVPSKLAGIKLSEYEKEGDFPVFDQGQDYISGFSSNKDLVVRDVPAILFGDHTRIVKYIKSPFVAGADGTKIFWAKEGFDSTFLYYLVLSQKIPNTGYNRHFKFFKDIKVVLPKSKTEQQKIAEILGTVDEDIAKTQEVIKATEKLKRGLMQQLFIPKKNWNNSVLSEIATIIMGQSPNSRNYNETDQGLPLIQGNTDIKNRRSIKRFSTSEVTKKINKGNIIMSVRAPVGCIALASFDSCIGRGICGIQPKKINCEYLYYYLINQEDKFEQKAQGSTFTAINSNEVKKIEIVFPEKKEEQQEIADILSVVDEKISINKKLKEKLILLKKGLMQDLLSGKVRINNI